MASFACARVGAPVPAWRTARTSGNTNNRRQQIKDSWITVMAERAIEYDGRQAYRYFFDNRRSISAATRKRPASIRASLRSDPSGILRASAMISVARSSQARLTGGC